MKQRHLRSTVLAMAALALLHVPASAQNAGEAAAWEPLRSSGSAQQLQAFLDTYPTGQFAPEARQKYSLAANMMLAPQVQSIDVRFPTEIRRIGRSVGPMRVVKLNILVQPDGKASDVKMVSSSGFDPYDGAAVEAARRPLIFPPWTMAWPWSCVSTTTSRSAFCATAPQATRHATTDAFRQPARPRPARCSPAELSAP